MKTFTSRLFNTAEPQTQLTEIVLAPSSHLIEEVYWDDNNIEHHISFQVNDSFQEAKSHAGEVMMLSTYAPGKSMGAEGTSPYLAILCDDFVYDAVEEYKETGTFTGAPEDMTALDGAFYFKARIRYYEGREESMMYFYGLRWDYLGNTGLCMVYPKAYRDTESEKKLMHVLDEAARSFRIVQKA